MEHETKTQLIKGGAVWSTIGLSEYLNVIGIQDWGDAAAFVAFIYSLILIGEWVYKKVKGPKK